MDTKKIKKTLAMCRNWLAENDEPIYAHTLFDLCEDALAELDKAPNAEPVAWMWRQMMYGYMGGWHQKCERYNPLDNPHVNRRDIEDLTPLYLAPSAGLTVDEAEECLVEHLAQYGPDWSAPARNRLRARLTAAIEAKR